jgi:sulfofructose kinase
VLPLAYPLCRYASVPIPLPLALPAPRTFDLVGLGQNSVDLVVRVPTFPTANSKLQLSSLSRLPGGQVASALVCCARLGWRTRYIGRFGDDDLGRFGRESLIGEGVDVEDAPTVAGARTRFAVVLVDEVRGDRTVLWDRDPRLAIAAKDLPIQSIQSACVLLVDAEDVAASTRAAILAREAGAVTVVDVDAVVDGVHELLERIDVIVVSEGLPEQLTGVASTGQALAEMSSALAAPLVCVTLGDEGCLARCAGQEIHSPAFDVDCVDSTGAGDAFRGGLISALLSRGEGGTVESVLRYANAVAALACRLPGARDALPRPDEVARLLTAESS